MGVGPRAHPRAPPPQPRDARSGAGCSSARPPTLRPVARARSTCADDPRAAASLVPPRPLHVSWPQCLTLVLVHVRLLRFLSLVTLHGTGVMQVELADTQ